MISSFLGIWKIWEVWTNIVLQLFTIISSCPVLVLFRSSHHFRLKSCEPSSSNMNAIMLRPSLFCYVYVSGVCCLVLLTLSLYFIRAASPDNSPGLQFDLKCPSLWPLGLLWIKQCQYCPQLQVSVQVVHLCVVVHPWNRSVGKEARGPCHVHFPCLLSASSQNNLLSPGLDRDTYSRRREGETRETTIPQGLLVCRCCTHTRPHVYTRFKIIEESLVYVAACSNAVKAVWGKTGIQNTLN